MITQLYANSLYLSLSLCLSLLWCGIVFAEPRLTLEVKTVEAIHGALLAIGVLIDYSEQEFLFPRFQGIFFKTFILKYFYNPDVDIHK